MKNKSFSLLFAVLSIIVITSCHEKTPQLALYIPKDVSTVLVVDTKTIADKINSSGITLDSIANMFNKNKNAKNWEDVKNSGIDLTMPVYIFNKMNSSMQAGQNQEVGFIASVKDKTKLEAFLKKQAGNATVQSGGAFQYLQLDNNAVAGWNDNAVIFTGSSNNAMDSSSAQLLKNCFTQSESNSVASIDGFKTMLAKKGDMQIWVNPSGSLAALPMLGMTKINQLYEGSYTEGVVNFENGKIIADVEGHFNKTMSDILQKYPSKEVKKDMIVNFPGTVTGFVAFAFNPKVVVDILHFLGFDTMADNYVSQMGFTTTDVMNAISGDIALMYSQNSSEDTSLSGTNFLFNFAIGDKVAFDKVMNGLVSKNVLSKNGNQYQLGMFGGHGFVIETTNDALLIASSDDLVKSYTTGNNKASLPADIDKEINGKSMLGYFDINSLIGKIKNSDTTGNKTAEAAKSTFKNLVFYSNKSDGNTSSGIFELNFVNQDENSLASLVKFMVVAQNERNLREQNRITPPDFPGDESDSTQGNSMH
ncbi:MAG: DUF4836 family protein [Bacteroidetes bacterium]|nr:DUF4836 family protein [Bacteroidota bacterium]